MRSSILGLTLFVVLGTLPATRALADEGKPAPEHKVTQSESYLMLEPMYATIMDGERPAGMLMVAIGLDIPDPKLRAETQRAMPLLRDDYVRSLMAFTSTHVKFSEQPDVADIADRLQRVTDRALHRTGAKVLLAEVASRLSH
jgi:hypothetical protein